MGVSSVLTASLAALVALLPTHVAADKPYLTDHETFQGGNWGDAPKQGFHTSSLHAGWYQINHFDVDKIDQSSPYIFMAGRYGNWGPSIVSAKDFSLIWADQHYGGLAQAARSWDDFRGQRVLSVFSGGAVRIYSQSYELLYSITPKGDLEGMHPDSHEAMLTKDGTVLMIVCPSHEVDLTNVGGPATGKRVGNCHVQEVDPVTDEVLFQFATLDYFKPEDANWHYHNEDTWDFCHMNSVEKVCHGKFLHSIHTCLCNLLILTSDATRLTRATSSSATATSAQSSWSTARLQRSSGSCGERRTCSPTSPTTAPRSSTGSTSHE